MSYNRTVYCSYCGGKGHNRRTCSNLKDYINNNPTSYRTHLEVERKKRQKTRACSYCGIAKHTVRTCTIKKEDKTRLATALRSARELVFEKIKKCGLGVGALYAREGGWNQPKVAYMVFKIDWEKCNGGDYFYFIGLNVATAAEASPKYDYYHPKTVHQTVSIMHNLDYLLCAAPSVSPPQAWLDGELYEEEEFFPKGTRRPGWAYRLLEDGKLWS